MKEYRNFIMASNENCIVTATYANCSTDVVYKKYMKNYLDFENLNNIDTLKVLNKHIAQIYQWKNEDRIVNKYYILIPSKLCKIIKDKIYVDWIKTGKTKKGVLLSDEELKQWIFFNNLYKHVYADIVIKPNSIHKTNENTAYRHVIVAKNIVDKIYSYLDKLTINNTNINNTNNDTNTNNINNINSH